MNTIIDVDRGVIMNNFIINLNAFIRIGGNQGDGKDDSRRINALLILAKKRCDIQARLDISQLLP